MDTVNPQKVMRISFPTLVFLVRLSTEVFQFIKLRKSFLPQNKALDTGVSKMAFKKSKISLIGMPPEPIGNQLKLVVAIF